MTTQTTVTEAERTAIEEELRAVLAACDAAADIVDVDAVFSYYSDMGELGFIYNGTFFPSRDAVVVFAREMFGQMQSQTHETNDLRISVLASDVAVMTWYGNVTGTDEDGNTGGGSFARTFVCAKEGNDWEFVHVHVSFLPQA